MSTEKACPPMGSRSRWVGNRGAVCILVVILLGVVGQTCPAQEALEKVAWMTGGTVVLGVYDYFGYNLARHDPTALTLYRVSFVVAQAAITYILYRKFGLPTAIGFNLIWWTFGTDMVYYGVCESNPNPSHAWPGRGAWAGESRNGITHAYWTAVGLLRGANPGVPIAGDTIVAQSIVGLALGITISVSF